MYKRQHRHRVLLEDAAPAVPEADVLVAVLAVPLADDGPDRGGEARAVAAARAEGLVACLDTMNPANVPFYEAHGLSVRHEARLGAGGPTVWAMAT